MMKRHLVLLLLLVPVAAFASKKKEYIEVTASTNPNNALVEDLVVSLEGKCALPATVYVQYGNEDAGFFQSQTSYFALACQKVQLARLRQCSEYEYKVFAVDANGKKLHSKKQTFKTGAVPAGMTYFNITKVGNPTPDLMITAVNAAIVADDSDLPVGPVFNAPPTNNKLGPLATGGPFIIEDNWVGQHTSSGLVAFDNDGQIVWYYEIGAPLAVAAVYKSPLIPNPQPGAAPLFDTGRFIVGVGFGDGPIDEQIRIINIDGTLVYNNPLVNTLNTDNVGTSFAIGNTGYTHDLIPPQSTPNQTYPAINPEFYYLGHQIVDPYYFQNYYASAPEKNLPWQDAHCNGGACAAGQALQESATIRAWFPSQYDVLKWSAADYVNPFWQRGVHTWIPYPQPIPFTMVPLNLLADSQINSFLQPQNTDQQVLWPQEWHHTNAIRRSENPNDLVTAAQSTNPNFPNGYAAYTVNLRQVNQTVVVYLDPQTLQFSPIQWAIGTSTDWTTFPPGYPAPSAPISYVTNLNPNDFTGPKQIAAGYAPTLFNFTDTYDYFFAAHDVHILNPIYSNTGDKSNPNLRQILMFDNGNNRPCQTSVLCQPGSPACGGANLCGASATAVPGTCAFTRALELEVDFSNNTSYKIWEYNPSRDCSNTQLQLDLANPAVGHGLFSNAQGSAQRLKSNGHTLVSFGQIVNFAKGLTGPQFVIEAAAENTSVGYYRFDAQPGAIYTLYRTLSYTSLNGETPISKIC